MVDEKHLYDAHEHLPIPTYEEATSSRPPSQQSRLGPQEVSDDAERQGLLGNDLPVQSNSRRRNGYYHPPSVQSVRSSEDSSALGSPVRESEDLELQREMEEMDILDPESAEGGRARRNRLRGRFSKRFYKITNTLSGFHLPRISWPSFGFGWLKSKLPTIPEEYRPGWAVLARLAGLILIISLVYMLVVSEIMPVGAGRLGQQFNPEWVRQFAQSKIETWRIQDNLRYITSYDHVGGSEGSYYLGQWIEGKFKESHMDKFAREEFFVYMNYPKEGGRRVAIVDPPELAWEAKLEEESVFEPPKPQTAAFHGMSASGNVTGPLIYANYGSKQDFKRLWDSDVDVRGAVVLVRYYGTQSDRAMKVKNAQDAGVAGLLIYSDPADDGFKKGEAWPDGRWRPDDGVQRGSVALTSWIAGDPLTPGRASTKDAERMSKDKNPGLVTIPSLPLAWRDAQKLLQALKGHGEELPEEWVGGVPDVDGWYSGHPDTSPKVNLQNFQDEVEKQRIYNVFGAFEGLEDKGKKIIIGNHRDSWCFGAADPGSGTAVLLEVARILGELRATGWRPLRTIEFASWDAEEYNLIGSTEHVEANMDDIRANALAYINVDVGVTGENLWADGSPIFKHAWIRVLDRVADPLQNKTLRELWDGGNGKIGGLGAGSDYVAFQDMAGCSSIDFGFAGPEHGDMYHSCYETFDWVSKYADPGFTYHALLAEVWVLLILELAQELIVPFHLDDYAGALAEEAQSLFDWTEKKGGNYDIEMFQPLYDAVALFQQRAKEFHAWEEFWYGQVYGTGGFEGPSLTTQRIAHNARMANFETNMLDLPKDGNDKEPHGIPGRDQYKHVIFGPDASGSGYDAAIFPFVRDAIEAKDFDLAKKQLQKTADILNNASDKLLH
ncbi:N-acetylated-alpha-linked acidic dipeptidase 2 [Zopfia rhizophila CBS 207.26]|uniref:N-acetylated-alpha-linked acidic dipeptidase 2 n=1 Tax=Zopfia rhizophila CBS 207.26 TaxID=1314779 RepID=A0A6A6EKH2_9PEZI|nr:N-acetylated-alpha-linked acidic dipeptidase 2 [Zopfia rhizophila CBS 207.26]